MKTMIVILLLPVAVISQAYSRYANLDYARFPLTYQYTQQMAGPSYGYQTQFYPLGGRGINISPYPYSSSYVPTSYNVPTYASYYKNYYTPPAGNDLYYNSGWNQLLNGNIRMGNDLAAIYLLCEGRICQG